MLNEEIRKEFDKLYEMSLPQQTEFIAKKLLEAGVQPSIISF